MELLAFKNRFEKESQQVPFEAVPHIEITPDRVRKDVVNFFNGYCTDLFASGVSIKDIDIEEIVSLAYGDLQSRLEQDPISISPGFIYFLSRSYNIIFYHRIANHIFYLQGGDEKKTMFYKSFAFGISETISAKTCIEIHPQARIGKNFVVDHGINTLIGATSEIGDDCTVMHNVLLGSRKITYNKNEKRHPTLGNHVRVGGGVRLLGPIHIGDHTSIGPDCIIKEDVPEYSVVQLERTVFTIKQKVKDWQAKVEQ
jgi:serine O-acetyltransferase